MLCVTDCVCCLKSKCVFSCCLQRYSVSRMLISAVCCNYSVSMTSTVCISPEDSKHVCINCANFPHCVCLLSAAVTLCHGLCLLSMDCVAFPLRNQFVYICCLQQLLCDHGLCWLSNGYSLRPLIVLLFL